MHTSVSHVGCQNVISHSQRAIRARKITRRIKDESCILMDERVLSRSWGCEMAARLLQFPMRNPELFSAEINSQVLCTTKLNQILYAAIQALPHVQDLRRREELKSALCELLLPEDGAA